MPHLPELLFIDEDGDACLAPSGREDNLVALPARDDHGEILNPDAWLRMVQAHNFFCSRPEAAQASELLSWQIAQNKADHPLGRFAVQTEQDGKYLRFKPAGADRWVSLGGPYASAEEARGQGAGYVAGILSALLPQPLPEASAEAVSSADP